MAVDPRERDEDAVLPTPIATRQWTKLILYGKRSDGSAFYVEVPWAPGEGVSLDPEASQLVRADVANALVTLNTWRDCGCDSQGGTQCGWHARHMPTQRTRGRK